MFTSSGGCTGQRTGAGHPGKAGRESLCDHQTSPKTVDSPCSFKVRRSDGKQKWESFIKHGCSGTGGKKREGELTPLPEPWGSGPSSQGGTAHPLPLLSQGFGLCGVRERADPHVLPSKASSLWLPTLVWDADGFSEEKADLCMRIEGLNFI